MGLSPKSALIRPIGHLLPAGGAKGTSSADFVPSPRSTAGESHLANKRLFCCGKSILGVLR
ncbi:hypothetical protein CN212_26285 [Sinorhizobium meliloti]|nr:hypothetical protein CN212_26285 [Sinorhizobium meliloti]